MSNHIVTLLVDASAFLHAKNVCRLPGFVYSGEAVEDFTTLVNIGDTANRRRHYLPNPIFFIMYQKFKVN